MPVLRRFMLHSEGPALWPDHKPLEEVLLLRATTPTSVWLGTHQGVPTALGSVVFHKEWFRDRNRYDITSAAIKTDVVRRWLSWDTAMTENSAADYTACVVGELLKSYILIIREVWRGKIEFPSLPQFMEEVAVRWSYDGKFGGIIVEYAGSGISAYQTLKATARESIRNLIFPIQPIGAKSIRANNASVWCKNGSVWLPHPSSAAPWLYDFEQELFAFPGAANDDQVDAFDQLINYLDAVLEEGYRARAGLNTSEMKEQNEYEV